VSILKHFPQVRYQSNGMFSYKTYEAQRAISRSIGLTIID
jgi:hypothetical protein